MMMGWTPAAMAGMMLRQPLAVAALMVDAYAEGARLWCSYWGPLGEPVIQVVDTIAAMQQRAITLVVETIDGMAPVD